MRPSLRSLAGLFIVHGSLLVGDRRARAGRTTGAAYSGNPVPNLGPARFPCPKERSTLRAQPRRIA